VERAQARDRDAFEMLVERHLRDVHRIRWPSSVRRMRCTSRKAVLDRIMESFEFAR
jgi:hypothetical protein